MSLVPIVIEESPKGERSFDIYSRLLRDRIVMVSGPIETNMANTIVAQDTMAVENKFDYGIAAGIGMEYATRKAGSYIIEARYYYGLGNIYGNSKSDYFGKSNFGQIVIKATYLFDIIKTKNDKIK